MDSVTIKIKKLSSNVITPEYKTDGSSGADLYAYLPHPSDPLIIESGQICTISTGISVEIPYGYEIQIRPRSGLASAGLTVINTPGTIDSDYRGEIKVMLINHGTHPFSVSDGMRIAQMVVAPVLRAKFKVVDKLDETKRGEGGFGSTGV